MEYPALSKSEFTLFRKCLKHLHNEVHGRGREAEIRKILEANPSILRIYLRFSSEHPSVRGPEREYLFCGGKFTYCENPECQNPTQWNKASKTYRRFCSTKCSAICSLEERRSRSMSRYGVEHPSMLLTTRKKMSESGRKRFSSANAPRIRAKAFSSKENKIFLDTGTEFYVYALLDPRKPGYFKYAHWTFDHEPFYIGKGKGNRAYTHLLNCDILGSSNEFKNRKIRSMQSKSKKDPIVCIKKKNLTETSAFDLEMRLIKAIGFLGLGPLTNLNSGGCGGNTYVRTKRILEASSKTQKRRHQAMTDEEKSAWNIAHTRFSVSEYQEQIKGKFCGRIRLTAIPEGHIRKSDRLSHTCRCGRVWEVKPIYLLSREVGCTMCNFI